MPNEAFWRAEARTFAAYLGSPRVPAAVAERYQSIVATWQRRGFDEWLGRIAARHPILASLADTYARRIRPYGDLRRRLTLMLALLESHGDTHARYDHAQPARATAVWLMLLGMGVAWGVRTLVALVLFAPVHVLANLAAMRR